MPNEIWTNWAPSDVNLTLDGNSVWKMSRFASQILFLRTEKGSSLSSGTSQAIFSWKSHPYWATTVVTSSAFSESGKGLRKINIWRDASRVVFSQKFKWTLIDADRGCQDGRHRWKIKRKQIGLAWCHDFCSTSFLEWREDWTWKLKQFQNCLWLSATWQLRSLSLLKWTQRHGFESWLSGFSKSKSYRALRQICSR